MAEELTKEEQRTDKFKDLISGLIFKGVTPGTIAKALHPDDEEERSKMRNTIRKMVYRDADVQARIAEHAHGRMIMALGTVTEALIRRAERGRPDAIKLLFEASGFHNPRVKHDHSGNISITLNMPRPERPALAEPGEPTNGQPVVDAEVVDEGVVEDGDQE